MFNNKRIKILEMKCKVFEEQIDTLRQQINGKRCYMGMEGGVIDSIEKHEIISNRQAAFMTELSNTINALLSYFKIEKIQRDAFIEIVKKK
jgi:hypothetical protein